jgi:hypothetical protein
MLDTPFYERYIEILHGWEAELIWLDGQTLVRSLIARESGLWKAGYTTKLGRGQTTKRRRKIYGSGDHIFSARDK